ncbi:transporter substrate-binding domain-containing protein [Sporolactobacillus shoreicorticis]|uniref:Transporter substrate-binding domain-containing protein n=1 Tax=Sporolactobacillus shoreicorticis TaxID=1923877 RepID=A0ABW5S384_9BACL|nr:transporter substrate-binding domain-containing protein [Sporolactobacillus shoreicorticis]MCO7124303.1 transporter substrate-binding domain-containing protein [Sporolactobacillus shoreicorticis]
MKKKFVASLLAFILLLTVAACGNSSASDKKKAVKVTTVNVGTEGAYPPYNYVDSNGKADGYDIAVMRAVDKKVPSLKFNYVPTAWDSIFVALESGKFDIIASNLGKNPEREKKYLFSEEPYLYGSSQIIYKAGRTDIKSLKDLNGKNVAAGVGTATTTQLEEYNKKHGNKITIKYTDGDINKALQEIDSKRVDATISNIITTNLTAKKLGIKVDGTTAPELGISPIHLLYVKNDRGSKYQKLIDKALISLRKDGTLKKLSEKYLGKDYTTEEAAAKE